MLINGGILVFSLINIVLLLTIFGVSIYCFVLFIKLAKKGIKALDIYINEKPNNKF